VTEPAEVRPTGEADVPVDSVVVPPVTHRVLRGAAVGLVVALVVVSALVVVRTGLVDGAVDVVRAYLRWLADLPGRL
jgi:hypothetical protein